MAVKSKNSKNNKNGQENGISDLIKQLWEAAVNLRGSIEPADYKRYVLPIIFLRFLSLRFEKRRDELARLISDPKSEYHTTNPKQISDILEDPGEYRAGGAFMVPTEARWDNIVAKAQSDDIKVRLDNILELLENTYPAKLRGLLPKIYSGSNLSPENVTGLINLFSKDIFKQEHNGEDLIGRVYQYFIGEFANSEGKRGGDYFTPPSIVRTLVAMLEPETGTVYDPCCGSGGMFVTSDEFIHHNRQLSFYGQESKDFTYRLCRMNLFIHGIDGNIELGNTYSDDQHATLKADYIISNPPFNDGAKSDIGWGASGLPDKDPRLKIGGVDMSLSPRNANTMWIMHFLSHLKHNGTAGFVMATGELSTSETNRLEVRKTLVENNYVDCIVQLTGQLFANTQIPCCLWFLSKNRDGTGGYRKRKNEILFIDARRLGILIPGSRKQKELSAEEIEQIASIYRTYKRINAPDDIPGFCNVTSIEKIREHKYALTPGRYVGTLDDEEDDEDFEEKMLRLVDKLNVQFSESGRLEDEIRENLRMLGLTNITEGK